jgi:hypothetical protein
MIYIGIDNGISGGMCAISQADGVIVSLDKMPIKKARSSNEVDVRAFHLWVTEVTRGNLSNAMYILEEPGGSKSAKAAKSMAGSFHSLRGFFETKLLRWERITPQLWQKNLLPGCKAGETKKRAFAKASELWPAESFILEGCRTPHDGIVDAALIAEYGRRKAL